MKFAFDNNFYEVLKLEIFEFEVKALKAFSSSIKKLKEIFRIQVVQAPRVKLVFENNFHLKNTSFKFQSFKFL